MTYNLYSSIIYLAQKRGIQLENYYEVLKIKNTATQEEIKKAYHNQAKIYHPDSNNTQDTTSKMQEIAHAYETLSNPQKRRSYDEKLNHSYKQYTEKEERKNQREQELEQLRKIREELLQERIKRQQQRKEELEQRQIKRQQQEKEKIKRNIKKNEERAERRKQNKKSNLFILTKIK